MKKFEFKKATVTEDETSVKVCSICKRTIMDETNKTGLCPRCTKNGKNAGVFAAMTAAGVVIKKFGKPALNFVVNRFIK